MSKLVSKMLNRDGSWNQKHYEKIVMWGGKYLKQFHQGLDDDNPKIREGCAEALGEIGYLDSVPILIDHVDDPDEFVRWDIVNSLEMILGFKGGVLTEWANCRLRDRHNLKRKLKIFWNNNKEYILTNGIRRKLRCCGGNAIPLWLSKYRPDEKTVVKKNKR